MTITKEQLQERAQPRRETVFVEALGGEVVVQGYSVAAASEIEMAAIIHTEAGPIIDSKENRLRSMCACLVEPKLELGVDTEWLQNCDVGLIDEILGHADRLSLRRVSDFESLKTFFKKNHLARRVWTVAVEKFGKCPELLDDVTEASFMTYLAAAEARDEEQAEADQAAIEKLSKKMS